MINEKDMFGKINKDASPVPEEGDLNTAAIKEGMTADERKLLQIDLEGVESGRGSEPLHAFADRDHNRGRSDRDFEAEEWYELDSAEDWAKEIHELGISEEEIDHAGLVKLFLSADWNKSGLAPELLARISAANERYNKRHNSK
ncbi:MAG: hypothetical protein KBA81_07900 [Rhabdochlamydiaceae bacterium]|jgi:hypothetical protein|nr:hypothetical protein [Rhabdochlamydiaceae bacterium]